MPDYLDVSPAAILSESGKFSDIADTARRIREDLRGRLNGLGPIAGTDVYGQQFDVQFEPAVDGTETVLEGVETGMENTRTNLEVASGLFTKSDYVNTDLGVRLQ